MDEKKPVLRLAFFNNFTALSKLLHAAFCADLLNFNTAVWLKTLDERRTVFLFTLHDWLLLTTANGIDATRRHTFVGQVGLDCIGATL